MESYTYYTSSSSSSSYLEEKKYKPQTSYHASLHSVRKSTPPKLLKKPIAPLPPTPPKIYKVDFMDFKEVVQRLTGAPEFQPRRLQSVAPSPLNIASATSSWDAAKKLLESPIKTPFLATYNELMSDTTLDTENNRCRGNAGPIFLPNSPAWFLFPPLSPITLSPARRSFPTLGPLLSPGTLSPAWCSYPPPSLGILSPGWSSFPVLSPGTISSLG